MANKPLVPPNLHDLVMNMYGSGKTGNEIKANLLSEHGITVSRSSITKLVTKLKQERNQDARAAVKEKVEQTALKDIDLINEAIESLRTEAYLSLAEAKVPKTRKSKSEYRSLLETMLKFIERKQSLMGLGENEVMFAAAKEEMLSEMTLLIEAAQEESKNANKQ